MNMKSKPMFYEMFLHNRPSVSIRKPPIQSVRTLLPLSGRRIWRVRTMEVESAIDMFSGACQHISS
jgi:hypothetical protein